MSSYELEARILADLCMKCGGRCCRNHFIFLSELEYVRLKECLNFREGSFDTPYGSMKAIDALHGSCPFLGREGCVLDPEKRPLICRLFPLRFILEKKGIGFHLSTLCPFRDEVRVLKTWLAKTREDALEELKRGWLKKEILCYGHYLRVSEDKLCEID
ncbi:MAG: YkgJ family cysteine cluster protein [Candidatus Altiarchaeota archaeon]|nr:YkgJ family cysteine cluster protein [Candidatus Altiarchaeota archaeon]